MRTLNAYILREMVAGLLMAVLVCTGLLLLGNLLREILSLLMAGQASPAVVLRGVALLIPYVLIYALPMGVLTAALLVFGRLSADQELTAARANGISLVCLALPVLGLSLVLCGVCAGINLDWGPRCRVAYKELVSRVAEARTQSLSTLLPVGRFVTEIPGFVIYADRIRGDELEDVLFFQLKDGQKVLDVRAPRARIERKEEGRLQITFQEGRLLQWVDRSVGAGEEGEPGPGPGAGEGGSEGSTGEAGRGGFWQSVTMNALPIEVAVPKATRGRGLPRITEMTWRQLLAQRRELHQLGIEDTTPLDVQIHRLIAFSFASFGFALVGIPLGVRAHRRETSAGVAMAIGLVLAYYGFLIVAQSLETRPEAVPWLIVWMPNVLFQGIGAWMLWRVNGGR